MFKQKYMESLNLNGLFTFLFFAWLGYVLFLYLTHPSKKKDKLPKVKIGVLELSPNLKIHIGRKTYWIHHWMVLSVIALIAIVYFEGIQYLTIIKGVAIGGIIQGLRYPDRFRVRHPRTVPQRAK